MLFAWGNQRQEKRQRGSVRIQYGCSSTDWNQRTTYAMSSRAPYLKLCHSSGLLFKHHQLSKIFTFLIVDCRLQGAFKTLFPQRSADGSSSLFLYIAITSPDSSIVYYKLSEGVVKPSV